MYRWILTLAVFLSPGAMADWLLDANNSSVSFVSVKNAQVAEPHVFTNLEGSVSANGEALVRIVLDSVETMVPVRNERMRELLFDTAAYPNATFEAQVPVAEITALETGEAMQLELDGTVSIHGHEAQQSFPVSVTRAGDDYIVSTVKPVIVDAAKFDLVGGIEKLREVAGLESIAPSVPVSFSLYFQK